MEEVVQNGAEEVVATPQDQNHEVPVQEQKPVDDRQERNWREMRRAYDELKQVAKTQSEVIEHLKTVQQTAVREVDELDSVSDDEFIPKGKVKNLVAKEARRIAQEIAQQETEKVMKQRDQSQYLDRLKRQFSDWEEIVTPETLAILEEQDPELAVAIAETKDPYKIGLQSYKYIKAMNLSNKVPETRRSKEVEKKLEQNAKTVQSPQAYDKRPMAQAFRITDSEKKSLYKEMMDYASQAGFSY